MHRLSVVQGEAKFLPFLLKSKTTGRPMPLANAVFLLVLKTNETDLVPVMVKADATFDKSLADTGRVKVLLTVTDTYQLAPAIYYGELRVTTNSVPPQIYKVKFEIEVETTGIPDALLNKVISLTAAEQLTTA